MRQVNTVECINKVISIQAWIGFQGSRSSMLSDFQTLALHTGQLHPHKVFLVLVYVRG